jgi:hypothetical protein
VEQRVPGDRQGAVCFINLGKIHASQEPLILAAKLPQSNASGAVSTAIEVSVSEAGKVGTQSTG